MDFEFRTPSALQLKQEIRRWYYGGQDSAEANKLLKWFEALFSGNMITDAVSELLWRLAEQSPMAVDSSLYHALLALYRRQIIGRSIRVYGVAADGIQYLFEKWEADANSRISTVLDKIDIHLDNERIWCKLNRISLPSALVALAGMAAMAIGIFFLLFFAWNVIQMLDFEAAVMGMLSTYYFDSTVTMVCLALCLLATGNLLIFLPRMAMTLCAGLLWTLYHKGRFRLRVRRVRQFKKAMETEGLGGYCEKLQAAAQNLADLPPDTPQNRDPSHTLVGQAGMEQVFQNFSVRPISSGWRARAFYEKVETCHIHSRVWVVILCIAVVLLIDFLQTGGSILAYLQGLI